MSPYVKKLAEQTGKDENKVAEIWKKAKNQIAQGKGITLEDFRKDDFELAEQEAKRALGLDETILDPSSFLTSEKSAKEYIETVVSANFSIGDVQRVANSSETILSGTGDEDEYEVQTRDPSESSDDSSESGEIEYEHSAGEVIESAEKRFDLPSVTDEKGMIEQIDRLIEQDEE